MNRLWIGLFAAVLLGSCSEKQRVGDGTSGMKKDAQEVAPVKVKTMTVGTATAEGGQSYSGSVEEESGTSLSFAGIGTVQSISVSEGQQVQKGQLIGVLDATSARNAYEAALATKEQALDAQERMKLLHDNGSLPDIKWIEVQTQVRQALASEQIAKKGLTDTKLYAPFSGYIAQKSVEAGANVAPGMPVVRLVKIDRVKVKISVPEEEIGRFSIGQTLTVAVAALGGRSFEAKVTEKGVSADPLSRSYEVKAVVSNPKHELLPGMIAEVTSQGVRHFVRSDLTKCLTPCEVPADIIQIDADNRPFVWTVKDGKALRTYVTLGDNSGANVVITSGLQTGDSVICEGQQKVSTGMEVKEVKSE